ncbi:Hydroxyacid-oxoacid transhydrogenase, mitochondrial [Wickerhamiella sorbophila]|uniref:Hydroxyacid-oxoacid transhydrogenase, mitochondrial n=1 Tax=Wickerhamiella sorbophila TaxID=45607 RepID=A0A2T0FMU9_9ASCO|nr:Hydroxyacid-oxoacid transhydrogenase, mitochondrial [Wickerhamiella sorbophila]PRT56289.1 Hydroxyacid-oxoacid transhydrogenase, mitochondrial [Wickerhamiella sorbophila]
MLSAPAGQSGKAEPDYAFEMAASNIRFGPGVTQEVGYDFKHLGVKRVAVFTDKTLLSMAPVAKALKALDSQGIKYDIYSDVIVEPKDYGVEDAIAWARKLQPEAYLAVGGGSVMDTAKLANLLQIYESNQLLDFVNAPIGKALPINRKLKPLIAIPTTAGTGSETTGTAIFDLPKIKAKVGVSSRALRPLLGIVDPENSALMPASIKASSGLDVLCHSLESYTAIPYNERTPRPSDPILRPAYQGANPISDVFSLQALRMVAEYLPRSVKDPEDTEAQHQTLLAASLAGVGFGNAGVHLCHGLSYPISSQNKGYTHEGYEKVGHPIIPHGVSVAVTAPAVFKFTAPSCPERHLEAAGILGANITNAKLESAGDILKETLQDFLYNKLGSAQPRGIKDLGFGSGDIESLVSGALPQRRVMTLEKSIHFASQDEIAKELGGILEETLSF